MKNHEYIVISGMNRSKVGKILGTVASVISALLIYVVFKLFDYAEYFNINANVPPSVLSLIGAGTIYMLLYTWFSSSLWKSSNFTQFLKVPNLSGEWECIGEGKTNNGEKFTWKSTIKIFQTWDKVRIRSDTSQSGSDSIAASILYDEGIGYRLLYNYRNDPKINEVELHSHIGFAELIFSEDLMSADGEYFNGRGRNTFGIMKLRRKT
ncbi:Cap15 family cyclic dinucleotide receptor domain-containing protein [Yersinia enterocolitica]|uniref:Cap15 family cyclic dinucleotide receptor domain-containing protein n=1 Tax=Yersinia kristensenii TaxID=28152 RepID=UPI0005DAC08C|nr:hypothetical protein [Yersinia kristensenii]CNF37011.1 Uncharacterised protein [Yersinia kristensenii]